MRQLGVSAMSGKSGAPNRLEAIRLSRGWTQYRLVIEIEQVARQLTIPIAQRMSLKVQVSRWENGGAISPKYRRILKIIYRASDDELGFTTSDHEDKGTGRLPPIPFHGSWIEAFELAAKEWDVDVKRRGL